MLDIFYIFCYHTSMKVKSKLFIILIVFCIVVMMSCGIVVAFAASAEGIDINPANVEFTHDAVITLTLVDDHYEVTGCNNDKIINNEVVIPDTYNGKDVTIIATNAFIDCTNLHYLVLGENITTIRAKSIKAINLKAIDVPCNTSNRPKTFKHVNPGAFYYTTAQNGFNFCVKGYATYDADGKRNNSETAMTTAAENFIKGICDRWIFTLSSSHCNSSWWEDNYIWYHYLVHAENESVDDSEYIPDPNDVSLITIKTYQTVWVYDDNSNDYGDGNDLTTFSQIYDKLGGRYDGFVSSNYVMFGFEYYNGGTLYSYDYDPSLYACNWQ